MINQDIVMRSMALGLTAQGVQNTARIICGNYYLISHLGHSYSVLLVQIYNFFGQYSSNLRNSCETQEAKKKKKDVVLSM